MSTSCEFALIRVARLDGEALHIDIGRQDKGDSQIGGDQLSIVVPDESPQWEFRPL